MTDRGRLQKWAANKRTCSTSLHVINYGHAELSTLVAWDLIRQLSLGSSSSIPSPFYNTHLENIAAYSSTSLTLHPVHSMPIPTDRKYFVKCLLSNPHNTLHTLHTATTVAGRTDLTTHPSPLPAAKHRGRLAEHRCLTGVSGRLQSSTRVHAL